MKISTMLMFMAGVLAGLAAICFVFPKEGVEIGGSTLTFPTIDEVLATQDDEEEVTGDTVRVLTPEDLLTMREEALKDDKEYVHYMSNDPARLYLPDEDYLDSLFEILDSAEVRAVRIMHYGDSQIELDRISSYLREQLQTEYGGMGVGLMPALQTVPTATISQSISPRPTYYLPYSADTIHQKRRDGDYGPMARCASLSGEARFTCRRSNVKNETPHSGMFNTLTVLARGNVKATCHANGQRVAMRDTANEGSALRILTASLPDTLKEASIQMEGNGTIYGISADGGKGVMVDNVPMRGCSGTVFTSIKEDVLEDYYRHYNVGLIILQYGGNSVPYLTDDKRISGYKEKLRQQVRLFKRLSPRSRILFIGPADMATSRQGSYHTYERLTQVIDSIRVMAHEEGIAFWNMYEAMGGHDSMVEWVKAGLGSGDYLHFTTRGADRVAKMLYDTMVFVRNHRREAEVKVTNGLDSMTVIME